MADKTSKLAIKNVSDGPKVVNAVPIVTLQPGESAEVEMLPAEIKVAKGTGWFDIGGDTTSDGPDLTILDRSVADMKTGLDALDPDHLKALREAEVAGKNRASALAAIDEAVSAKETPAS